MDKESLKKQKAFWKKRVKEIEDRMEHTRNYMLYLELKKKYNEACIKYDAVCKAVLRGVADNRRRKEPAQTVSIPFFNFSPGYDI